MKKEKVYIFDGGTIEYVPQEFIRKVNCLIRDKEGKMKDSFIVDQLVLDRLDTKTDATFKSTLISVNEPFKCEVLRLKNPEFEMMEFSLHYKNPKKNKKEIVMGERMPEKDEKELVLKCSPSKRHLFDAENLEIA